MFQCLKSLPFTNYGHSHSESGLHFSCPHLLITLRPPVVFRMTSHTRSSCFSRATLKPGSGLYHIYPMIARILHPSQSQCWIMHSNAETKSFYKICISLGFSWSISGSSVSMDIQCMDKHNMYRKEHPHVCTVQVCFHKLICWFSLMCTDSELTVLTRKPVSVWVTTL